jgi:hypothetical protein
VASDPSPELSLAPLDRPAQPLRQWLTMFDLVLVALDPFTHESAWIVPTAARLLSKFREADCRVAFLVAGTPDECRAFLGPQHRNWLVFADPDRAAIKEFGLQRLPALIHVATDGSIAGVAEGWDPPAWRDVVTRLAKAMAWIPPVVPAPGDPRPYEGTPALA